VEEIYRKNEYFRTPLTPVRNEYQEYFLEDQGGRCAGLTTLPLSCTNCLEIWDLWVCPGL